MLMSRRALLRLAGPAALGLGPRGPVEVEVLVEDLTGGDPDFARRLA